MSVTVIVRFEAKDGQGDALVAYLQANQPKLRAFPGFEHIALHRDASAPGRVVEIERWKRAEDHRAMVTAVAEAKGWATLEALLASEPETSYLDEVASLSRGPEGEPVPGRATGIGGVFLRSKTADPSALRRFYGEALGLWVREDGTGTELHFRHDDDPSRRGLTAWNVFRGDTEYFGAAVPFLINYRVDDLDAALARLRRAGAMVDDRIEDEGYGRFGWATDPDGNRLELWEPRGE